MSRTQDLIEQTTDEVTLLNLEFLKLELQTFIDGYPFKGFFFPISYLEGLQVDFQRLIEWTTFETKEDYVDLIARYRQFTVYVSQGEE